MRTITISERTKDIIRATSFLFVFYYTYYYWGQQYSLVGGL